MGVVAAGSFVPTLVLSRKTRPVTQGPWANSYGAKRGSHADRRTLLMAGSSSFFCNPTDDPILKDALKEPVAFLGGMFAGLLRLDLNEEPLREWVARTVEASGIKEEVDVEEGVAEAGDDEAPQQIQIE